MAIMKQTLTTLLKEHSRSQAEARLLDIVRRFMVFDSGVRKVARHQQFFGIRKALEASPSCRSPSSSTPRPLWGG
jgi:type I site-specific restriction-modification system R (restriction) subunit